MLNGCLLSLLFQFFLSIYTIEFLVKVYAQPYAYWRSGFNIFDFIVLIVSLIKVSHLPQSMQSDPNFILC